MALSRLPGYRWEQRGDNWWRVNDALNIDDGPYAEPHEGAVATVVLTTPPDAHGRRFRVEQQGGYFYVSTSLDGDPWEPSCQRRTIEEVIGYIAGVMAG